MARNMMRTAVGDAGAMRPPSFDEDRMTEWSKWVLDHGLPDIPEALQVGESVPVAYWAGPRFGAVLHVQWSWSEEHTDDDLISEVQLFDRVPDGWRCYGAQGGTDWFDPPFCRPNMSPREADLGGIFIAHEDGRSCCAADGLAGIDAAVVEVVDEQGPIRKRLDSPLGAFIAAFDGANEATICVLDEAGHVLLEQTIGGRPCP